MFKPWRIFKLLNKDKKLEESSDDIKSILNSEDFSEINARLKNASAIKLLDVLKRYLAPKDANGVNDFAMDSDDAFAPNVNLSTLCAPSTYNLTDAALSFYASNGFIGYQSCALISQNWLVNKICSLPAQDAVRRGYSINFLRGDLPEEIIKKIESKCCNFDLNETLESYAKWCRVFGIRIAIISVESDDPNYYDKPFNIDGVAEGSYQGLIQVDPQWCAGLLNYEGASKPDSKDFYEPTWWIINGKRYHKSHLIIARYKPVPNTLKPSYSYGGISVVQEVYSIIFKAETLLQEQADLVRTKRMTILKTDLLTALSDQDRFISTMNFYTNVQDNFGLKIADTNDEISQINTDLNDLPEIVSQMFDIVSATAGIPKEILLANEGFTGSTKSLINNYTNSSNVYNQLLERTQNNIINPLLKRHIELVLKSEFPTLNLTAEDFNINWQNTDTPSIIEETEILQKQAETDAIYVDRGIISVDEVRNKLTKDADNGYDNLNKPPMEGNLDYD